MLIFLVFDKSVTDGWTDGRTDGLTDGPTDRPTDIPEYKDTRTHMKISKTNLKITDATTLRKFDTISKKRGTNVS